MTNARAHVYTHATLRARLYTGTAAYAPRPRAYLPRWHRRERAAACSISASPTACLSRGYSCAGTQNDRLGRELSNGDILVTITIMSPKLV